MNMNNQKDKAMKKVILVLGLMIGLVGCNEKTYDSAYYKANPEKADEVLRKCESGEVSGSNCDNARDGLDAYKAQKLKDHLLGKDKSN